MRSERGSALVAGLLALVLAGAVAAGLAELARLTVVQHRLREQATRAWLLAEAGLAETLASIPPGIGFADVLTHPTRQGGTGPWVWSSRLSASLDDGESIVVQVEARGPAPVRRRLEALITRQDEPYLPGALTAAGRVRELTRDFRLNGRNFDMAYRCSTAMNAPTRAGLAIASDASLPAIDPMQVLGRGGHGSIRRTGLPDLAPLRDASGGAVAAPGPLAGPLGVEGAPRFTVVHGDALVSETVTGTGLLYVDGRLSIRGTLDFTGVVAARAGIDVSASGLLDVCGALWAAGDPAVAVRGRGSVRRSVDALEMAGRLAPLPARAEAIAIREYFGGANG